MANLTESPVYAPAIYQLEQTDPILGGADGVSNVQARQLANRTSYLKKALGEFFQALFIDAYGACPHAQDGDRIAYNATAVLQALKAVIRNVIAEYQTIPSPNDPALSEVLDARPSTPYYAVSGFIGSIYSAASYPAFDWYAAYLDRFRPAGTSYAEV
jgi:hypothetical protein